MIRNLKILTLAAMVLGVLGASVEGAQAAEEFHCDVAPCTFTLNKDGTGTTAHHVFVVKNKAGESISFTCDQLTGDGTSPTKTATELTVTGLAYDGCKSVLGAVTVHMHGCDYHLTSHSGGADKATVTIKCPKEGDVIEITNGPCTVTVPPQGPLPGIGYHNSPTPEGKTEVTVTTKVPNITVVLHGDCGVATEVPTEHLTGEYTTGNTLATGETTTGVMVNAWWE